MKRLNLFLLCLIATYGGLYADNPPLWMRGDMPQQSNRTYYFKVLQGEGSTQMEARNNAIIGLVGELARTQGVSVKGSDILQNISKSNNGVYSEQSLMQSTYNIETDEFKTSFDAVDEYYDNNSCWILFEVAYNPISVSFDKVEFTTDYGARAVLKSAIVSGWGQMYKQNTNKGITILSLQVASIAGGIIFNNLSNNYYNKALNERDNATRESYQDRSTSFSNVRNGCFIAAGAIYVFNIVDAIVGKGAKRYKVTSYIDNNSQGATLGITLSKRF